MSKSLNKVCLIGNIGNDIELKSGNDWYLCNVSLATSEEWKDKTTGERKQTVEWHKVVFYNKLAQVVAEYLKKGSKIYIEGKLKTKKYTDKAGVDKYTTEIIADQMIMLDSRPESKQESKEDMRTPSKQIEDAPFQDDDIPF
jgi:single-strand DNA-binding protein